MTTAVNENQTNVHIDEIEQFLKYSTSHLQNAQEIVDSIKQRAGEYMSADLLPKIQEAYVYAAKAHEGQTRLSGEPYIIHPLRATEILMSIKPDIYSIQTCILHDVIEDTHVTYEDIQREFGQEVADLCEGLVKVSKVRYKGEERQIETLKKTFLAMAKDLRVIFVKIADRIHNIQTLHFHPKPEKRKRIAVETLKIYVPICRKLGLYKFQLYLENGVFKILYPDGYRRVLDYLKKKYGKADLYIEQGKRKIEKILRKAGVNSFTLKGRIKSPYRIHEKLRLKYNSMDFSKVLDVLAFRVIVTSIGDCYNTLGVMHKEYSPLINKIKDYIAVPKFNNYQSLHTTVLGMFNFPVEIQIRTTSMEQIAEYGVAAHFAYSEKNGTTSIPDKQTNWIKQLKDLVDDYKETEKEAVDQFKTNLDIEVLTKKIFVYTPKGDVIEFPAGSTVLDFAFRVHTDVGLKFKNAMINGAIKPISHVLETGDVVQINTFKNRETATRDWMHFLHTPTAKAKLARYMRKQEIDLYHQKGKEMLLHSLKKYSLPSIGQEGDKISLLHNEDELNALFLSYVDRQKAPMALVREVYPQEVKKIEDAMATKKSQKKTASHEKTTKDVVIDGLIHLPYVMCKLCNPDNDARIIAKVGRSGIKIHKTSCAALNSIAFDKLVEAHWRGEEMNEYKVKLMITMPNKSSNLVRLMQVFKDMDVSIDHMSVANHMKDHFTITIETFHQNPTKISYLLKDLKKMNSFITGIKTKIT